MKQRTTFFITLLLLIVIAVVGGAVWLFGGVQEGWQSSASIPGYNPPAFKTFFYKYNLNNAASSNWCGADDGTCTGGILADTSPSIGPGVGAMINTSGQCQDGVPLGDQAICECYQLQKQHQDGSVQFTQSSSPFCVPCPDGAVCPNPREHWCKPNYQSAAGGFGCEACPAGQTSLGGRKTDQNGGKCTTPTCQPGHYIPSGTTTCAECPVDHYCPGGTSLETACPSGTTALPGSSSASDCKTPPPPAPPAPPTCSQGQYLDSSDNTCKSCPTGSVPWRNTSSDPWSCVNLTCQAPGSADNGWFDVTLYPSSTHWTGQAGCDIQGGETCEVPDAARLSAAAAQIAAGGVTGAQVYTNMMCRRPLAPGGGGSTPGGGGSGPAPAPTPAPRSFTPSGKYALCCLTGAYGQGGDATAPGSLVRIWSSQEAAQNRSTDTTEIVQQGGTGGCGNVNDVSVWSKVREVSLEWLDARGTAGEWSNPCVCNGTIIQSEPWCSAGLHTKDGGPNPTSSICASGSSHGGGLPPQPTGC